MPKRNRKGNKTVVMVGPLPQGVTRRPRVRKANKSGKKSSKSHAMGSAKMFAMQVCGLTNPFCPEAMDAKWPDNTYQKTLTWNNIGASWQITTDAQGEAAHIITADPYNARYDATVVGDVATYAAATAVVAPPAALQRFRVISCGVKISCTTPLMVTQGYAAIRLMSRVGVGPATTSCVSPNVDEFVDIPLVNLINKEAYIVLKPIGDKARDYVIGSSAYTWANFPNGPSFQVCQISVIGGIAGSPCIKVDYYQHIEYVPVAGDATETFAQKPPVANLPLTTAADKLTTQGGSIIQGSIKTVEKWYESGALNNFINSMGTAYSAYTATGNPIIGVGAGLSRLTLRDRM